MVVLVLGASGQLGQCFREIGSDVHTLHFFSSSDIDICNVVQIKNAVRKYNPDFIINCAAYTAVDLAENEPEKAFAINGDAVENLARICQDNQIGLMHFSTDFVFDGNQHVPYLEQTVPNPISVYGHSKLKGEQAIQKIMKRYYIVRVSWLYSEYGNNFLKTILRLAQTRKELHIVSDQQGTPTYARNVAKYSLEMIEQSLSFGLYHYTEQGKTTWFGFAKKIIQTAGLNVQLIPTSTKAYNAPAARPYYSVLDASKLRSALKIMPENWEDMVEKTTKKILKAPLNQ